MELSVRDTTTVVSVSDVVFAAAFNESLIHQTVVAYLSGARTGTHAQKTRSQVSGGNSKPWRQKGTGRARAGTTRSPLWRGGGKVFAAVTGDYSQKLNKKMYRSALRSIMSELIRQERLIVLEKLALDAPKTKLLISQLNTFGLKDSVLIIVDDEAVNLQLAARNLYQVFVKTCAEIDPVSLVSFEKVVITASALKKIEERLS